jgi:hypothetical protein
MKYAVIIILPLGIDRQSQFQEIDIASIQGRRGSRGNMLE